MNIGTGHAIWYMQSNLLSENQSPGGSQCRKSQGKIVETKANSRKHLVMQWRSTHLPRALLVTYAYTAIVIETAPKESAAVLAYKHCEGVPAHNLMVSPGKPGWVCQNWGRSFVITLAMHTL